VKPTKSEESLQSSPHRRTTRKNAVKRQRAADSKVDHTGEENSNGRKSNELPGIALTSPCAGTVLGRKRFPELKENRGPGLQIGKGGGHKIGGTARVYDHQRVPLASGFWKALKSRAPRLDRNRRGTPFRLAYKEKRRRNKETPKYWLAPGNRGLYQGGAVGTYPGLPKRKRGEAGCARAQSRKVEEERRTAPTSTSRDSLFAAYKRMKGKGYRGPPTRSRSHQEKGRKGDKADRKENRREDPRGGYLQGKISESPTD